MKIVCTKCSKKKETNTNSMKKLVAKFGSKEEVIAKYTCRDCRKEYNVRADGKMKPTKNTRKGRAYKGFTKDDSGNTIIPDWMSAPIKSKSSLPEVSKEEMAASDICWRPDIWTANKGACNGCSHYKVSCGCRNTKILTEKEMKSLEDQPTRKSRKMKKMKKTKKAKKTK
jgi:hypothetical protein